MDELNGEGLSQKVAAALQRAFARAPVGPAIENSAASQKPALAKYWDKPPDFSEPAMVPGSSRPPTGPRSFTLMCERLSRGVDHGDPFAAYVLGRTTYAGRATTIPRDGAARKSIYLAGAGSLELVDDPRGPEKALGASEYINRSDAVEIFKHRSVETNIPGGASGRRKYWTETADHEEAAKQPFVILSRDEAPEWWKAVRDRPDVPPELVQAIGADVAAMGRPERIKLKKSRFAEIVDWLRSAAPGCPQPWASGMDGGGTVQFHIIAEVPTGLSPRERRTILRRTCSRLKAGGFMYEGVLHRPSKDNHPDNWHIHLLVHDRTCKLITVDGKEVWDHAYRRPVEGRPGRTSRPFRRDKVWKDLGVDQTPEGMRKWFTELRQNYAEDVNTVLTARGSLISFHPGKQQREVWDRPTAHVGRNAWRLELLGVPTVNGKGNAKIQQLRKRMGSLGEARQAGDLEIQTVTAVRAVIDEPDHPAFDRLLEAANEKKRELVNIEEQLADIRWQEERALSRPRQTEEYCRRKGEELAAKTTRTSQRNREQFEERANAAAAVAHTIARELQPLRQAIADLRSLADSRAAHLREFVKREIHAVLFPTQPVVMQALT